MNIPERSSHVGGNQIKKLRDRWRITLNAKLGIEAWNERTGQGKFSIDKICSEIWREDHRQQRLTLCGTK
jgi:hypothetical protein